VNPVTTEHSDNIMKNSILANLYRFAGAATVALGVAAVVKPASGRLW